MSGSNLKAHEPLELNLAAGGLAGTSKGGNQAPR